MNRKTVIVMASLLLSGLPVWAQPTPPATVYSNAPTGEGDPQGITCRPPQHLPDSRLLGPQVCKTNAVWAQYRKDGMVVAADGIHDAPSEKQRSTNPRACRPQTAGGGSTSTMNQMNFSMICD
jgi:hypothetical protein